MHLANTAVCRQCHRLPKIISMWPNESSMEVKPECYPTLLAIAQTVFRRRMSVVGHSKGSSSWQSLWPCVDLRRAKLAAVRLPADHAVDSRKHARDCAVFGTSDSSMVIDGLYTLLPRESGRRMWKNAPSHSVDVWMLASFRDSQAFKGTLCLLSLIPNAKLHLALRWRKA